MPLLNAGAISRITDWVDDITNGQSVAGEGPFPAKLAVSLALGSGADSKRTRDKGQHHQARGDSTSWKESKAWQNIELAYDMTEKYQLVFW